MLNIHDDDAHFPRSLIEISQECFVMDGDFYVSVKRCCHTQTFRGHAKYSINILLLVCAEKS